MTVLVRDFEEIAHMRFQVSESIGISIVTMDHEAFEIMERCRLSSMEPRRSSGLGSTQKISQKGLGPLRRIVPHAFLHQVPNSSGLKNHRTGPYCNSEGPLGGDLCTFSGLFLRTFIQDFFAEIHLDGIKQNSRPNRCGVQVVLIPLHEVNEGT